MTRTQAKYKQVASVLRNRILNGGYAVGKSLPTIKDMAVDFNVSFVTAFRAVGLLSAEGLISTASKRLGAVVIRNQPGSARATTIACLLRRMRPRNELDNFALDMIQGLRDEISRRDYRMIYHGLDERDYEGRMRNLILSGQVCAVLLDQDTPRATVEQLLKEGLPVATFNRRLNLPGLTSVLPDYEAAGRAAADFLLSRGYERLGFYKMPRDEAGWSGDGEGDVYPRVALRQAFQSRALERGVKRDRLLFMPEAQSSEESCEPETYGLPRRKGPRWRATGIFCNHDGHAVNLIAAIAKTNLVLGEDVGVLGCLDLEVGRRSPRPPSTFTVAREAIGAATVRELLARVQDPTAPVTSIQLALEFVNRGTA